ncbi:TetR family transcriptional regulator [Asanoa ferruginea]|uniref:TetR family transcriptional regulator n=1 Tax=Asanoa ferruginea TaxID=53367 RepID=A0A3D9ZYX3_9ACTN|nr:TetR family transcriptional regulator [Asanoa ferruginea]REG02302.1 TetR family transcriptional regulator [Asanoa ferruginea]GIF46539.1 TetR family transcriptional regulator [Asanoa ferruginea]
MPVNRDQVLHEAMRLLDDEGLDALTLRALAARLGVQAPTLYWHVKNKAALLDALADAIMDEAIAAIPAPAQDGDGREWLLAALSQLRAAMLRHRDGARIVSGARYSMRRADFSELAMATLVDRGTDLHHARLLVLAGERYTVGFVLEEQSPAPDAPDVDIAALQARFPVATRAITEYFTAGHTADDLYRDIARLVLNLPDETR